MKSSIVIGPIKRTKREKQHHVVIQDRLSKMKNGNYFEISGISNKRDVSNIRASICYFSKKKGIKVSTTVTGGILRVEKVRSETKSAVGV